MGALSSVCTTNLSNLGSGGCSTSNPFLDPVAIILTNKSFYFSSAANFATFTQWTTGIAEGKVFPLQGITEYEDQSEETQYYESPTGNRVVRRLGKYRFVFRFNKPLTVHKKLQSFRNADLRMFIVDSNGNIWGTNPSGTVGAEVVKGFQISMFNPEKLTLPGADGTPAWSAITMDLYDPQEWNEYGIYVNPTSWNPTDLQALVDVRLVEESATGTSVVIGVYYDDGYTSAGAVNKIGIAGLVYVPSASATASLHDFVFTASGGNVIDGFTDNADGTYTFTAASGATAFVNGSKFGIQVPSALLNLSGLIIENSGTDVTLTGV